MINPVYYRLSKDGHFVGFKRVVTEFLPVIATRWQLDPVDHDENATHKLTQAAMGIAKLGREKIISSNKQRRVTHPKSKEQAEPEPGSESGDIREFMKSDLAKIKAFIAGADFQNERIRELESENEQLRKLLQDALPH